MDWKEHSYKYKIVAWSGNRWDIQVLICVFFCRGSKEEKSIGAVEAMVMMGLGGSGVSLSLVSQIVHVSKR